MKMINYYILFLGLAYVISSFMFILENINIIKIGLNQIIPADAGMALYFLTVGTLYNYAYFKSSEEVFKTSLLLASIMSIALMSVQALHYSLQFIGQIVSDHNIEVLFNLVRIEIILGILSIPILLKERRTIHD